VAIVNSAFAQRYLHGVDPIGRRIGWGDPPKVKYEMEVIGVVGDVVYGDPRQAAKPVIYAWRWAPDRRSILFDEIRGAFRLVAFGIAIGVPVAVAGAQLIRSQLFGVSAWDPFTLVSISFAIELHESGEHSNPRIDSMNLLTLSNPRGSNFPESDRDDRRKPPRTRAEHRLEISVGRFGRQTGERPLSRRPERPRAHRRHD
jgi:hypothetical protein